MPLDSPVAAPEAIALREGPLGHTLNRPGRDRLVQGSAAVLLVAGAGSVYGVAGFRQALLYLVGVAFGLVLYHAAFGFTSAWRVFIADRRGAGVRAQMAMLALATTLFFPALAAGTLFGQPVAGFVAPAGVSVAVGAFIFGLGMQLGGGCASGTLYAVGGGSIRMLLTLAAFIAGATFAASHLQWWRALPGPPPISLVDLWGPLVALAANLLVFALVVLATLVLERRRHGALEHDHASPRRHGLARILRGPWPLYAGAVGLALLNFATLAIAGRPWGITGAFTLWGSKVLAATGLADPAAWPYWSGDDGHALSASILTDVTSVMDIGIMVGALCAAALAGRIAPTWRIPIRSAVAALVGGLMLGYGARLAYGCNIGAFFSGVASGSLHGWLWIVAAFVGNAFGTWMRPGFGLAAERGPRIDPSAA